MVENYHSCSYCACHSPIFKILENSNFLNSSVISKITEGLKESITPKTKPIIFTGGIIRPLIGGSMDSVEAIGFNDGKVLASGSLQSIEEAMKSAGITSYEKIKLENGQTLLPGLIDPHVHIVITALMRGWKDFGAFDGQHLKSVYNIDTLKEDILNNIPENESDWLLAKEVDPSLMPFKKDKGKDGLNQLTPIDCNFLDETIKEQAPNAKIFMMSASMHTAYLNTNALRETYDKSSELQKTYNTFDNYKEATNGVLEEIDGITPAIKAIPLTQISHMITELPKHTKELFEEASMRGITMLYDAGMSDLMENFLKVYLLYNENSVRIGCAYFCDSVESANKLKKFEPITEYKNIYRGNIKLVSDGSNQGLTGFQCESYCCEAQYPTGIFNFAEKDKPNPYKPTDEYIQLMKTIVDKDWSLMVHANGNKAVDFAIKTYKEVLNNTPNPEKRHRIEHCSLLTSENISEMKRLNLSPSFLIGHVGYWGYPFKEAIFEEKSQMLDLCKSALNEGLKISFHSDNSVTPLGPLRMMEQAITRKIESPLAPPNTILNEKECVSAEEALRAVTYDAAWQCSADKWVGSLDNGYYADFVILEKDPLGMKDYTNMRDIKVLQTWKDGINYYLAK